MTKLRYQRDGFSAIEFLIVLLVAVVLGFAGWYFVNHHNNKPKTSTTTQSNTVTESNITIPQQIAALKNSIPAQYSTVKVAAKSTDSSNVVYLDYQVSGYSYSALDEGIPADYTIQFVPTDSKADVPDGVKTAVQSELTSAGFVKSDYASKQYGGRQSTNNNDLYYTTSTKVCDINISKQPNAPWVILACDTKDKLADIAKQASAFKAAYETGNSNKAPQYMGLPQIDTNKAGTYHTALVSIDGRGAYFYKKTGDTTWHYFGSSLEGLGCNDIASNPGAKLAFADICNKN